MDDEDNQEVEFSSNPKPRDSRFRAQAINVGVLLVSCAIVLVLCELVLRHRYAHMVYTPHPEVIAIQQYLRADPDIGYTWQKNVEASKHIDLSYSDVHLPPLSTDKWGFSNAPHAILERPLRPVDVVGLGDSFMEHGAVEFYKSFHEQGMFYYSLAMHRQCPPQYTTILEHIAIDLKPRWVIYGLFENDFTETSDYDAWRQSGLDWLTFHSGTWCGPPIGASWTQRFVTQDLRGCYAFYRVLHAKLRGERMSVTGPSESEISRVVLCIEQAAKDCASIHSQFLLVFIPSRETILHGETKESAVYDEVTRRATSPLVQVLDLRPVFHAAPNPESLFYAQDAHWNEAGIKLACDQFIAYIASHRNAPK